MNVARYDQQAVLMANVEEARYQVLMSTDGKELVQARYAVRNNQRNFVKISLPTGATVWSASLAGRPIRPGQSPDGNLLLPLEKSRGGDEAPAFEIEILYLTKATAWEEKGREKILLPALDLPISRTGLLLYYPPTFRVTAEPGTFRSQEYQGPNLSSLAPAATALRDRPGMLPQRQFKKKRTGWNSSRSFRRRTTKPGKTQHKPCSIPSGQNLRGKSCRHPSCKVPFPSFGPSIFLVSELTSENQLPSAELSFQRDKKAGVR